MLQTLYSYSEWLIKWIVPFAKIETPQKTRDKNREREKERLRCSCRNVLIIELENVIAHSNKLRGGNNMTTPD